MAKLNFQQSLLPSSVSHDPLFQYADLMLNKHFLLAMLKAVMLLNIFLDFLMYSTSQELYFILLFIFFT